MENKLYTNYLEVLRSELRPALGCAEPIAAAYAAAKGRGRYQGKRSLGGRDAGAARAALILKVPCQIG